MAQLTLFEWHHDGEIMWRHQTPHFGLLVIHYANGYAPFIQNTKDTIRRQESYKKTLLEAQLQAEDWYLQEIRREAAHIGCVLVHGAPLER